MAKKVVTHCENGWLDARGADVLFARPRVPSIRKCVCITVNRPNLFLVRVVALWRDDLKYSRPNKKTGSSDVEIHRFWRIRSKQQMCDKCCVTGGSRVSASVKCFWVPLWVIITISGSTKNLESSDALVKWEKNKKKKLRWSCCLPTTATTATAAPNEFTAAAAATGCWKKGRERESYLDPKQASRLQQQQQQQARV